MPFPLLIGGAPSRYRINQSLRFRASNSAHLTRTQTTPTDRKKLTFSCWHKRGSQIGSAAVWALLHLGNDNNTFTEVGFASAAADQFYVQIFSGAAYQGELRTNAVFRDPSAWYHIVLAIDTTQATAANRIRLYVNGTELTSFAVSTYPALNLDLPGFANALNSALMRYLGTTNYTDGYLSEVYFIDGQQLSPSSFGQTDTTTGAWVPRRYTGTYGTNGFYLPFNDATSTTTISQDRSGNGNNWTSSGISVTAGVTMDQVIDSPTSGAAGTQPVGNYATLNNLVAGTTVPLWANLRSGANDVNYWPVNSTIRMPASGQWYFEMTVTAVGGGAGIGITDTPLSGSTTPGGTATSYAYFSGGFKGNNSSYPAYGATYTTGDVISCLLDVGAGTLVFWKNGVSQGTAFSGLPVSEYYFLQAASTGSGLVDANFGQRAFAYTPPTGFLALCTANLATPTIPRGDDAFAVNLYTGNGGAQTVDNGRFQPDLIWGKSRSAANWHGLWDAVRGGNNLLYSNASDAETSATNLNMTRTATGFSVNGANSSFNPNGVTQVAWQWREGAAYGFDIVTYTGNATNRTIAHGLNAVPHLMIAKERSPNTNDWSVYHRNANANPQNGALFLNLTDAFTSNVLYWNNTAPTSSVFSLGAGNGTNRNLATYVAYLWTSIPGFSLFGSYTGNGSADGPFVWCGFRPRFVMWKNASGTASSWNIMDAARSPTNVVDDNLFPNLSNAEVANDSAYAVDFTANGFKVRNTNTGFNESGQTIIFAAFAEHPFKFANAR